MSKILYPAWQEDTILYFVGVLPGECKVEVHTTCESVVVWLCGGPLVCFEYLDLQYDQIRNVPYVNLFQSRGIESVAASKQFIFKCESLWRACEHSIIMFFAECWRVLLWLHHLAYHSHHSCKSRGVVRNCGIMQRLGVAASKQFTFNLKVCEYEPLSIVRNLGRSILLSCWWIVWSFYSPGLSHQSDVQLNQKILESLHIVFHDRTPKILLLWSFGPTLWFRSLLRCCVMGEVCCMRIYCGNSLWDHSHHVRDVDKSWVNFVVWSCDL